MVLYVAHDTLNRLPPLARQRVKEMAMAHEDGQLLTQAAARRLKEIQDRLYGLRERRAYAMKGEAAFPDHAFRELEALERDEAATKASIDERRRQGREAATIFAQVERWLTTGDRAADHIDDALVELVDVPLPEPKGDLEEIRLAISELEHRRNRIHRAPLPMEDLERRVMSEVMGMAGRGKPNIAVGHDGRVKVSLPSANPLSVLSWFDPEAVAKRLLADLIPRHGGDGALSPAQKRKALADVSVELLELERIEEALVRASPGPVPRRVAADVRAVLSIDAVPARRRAAA